MSQPIDNIIRTRKTAKILRDPTACMDISEDVQENLRQKLHEIIELAAWAPFHRVANKQAHRQDTMQSAVPWRFFVLEKATCCQVVQHIERQATEHPDSKWAKAWQSKIPKLLAGCGALMQVTWLPEPPEQGDTPALTNENVEHIAAASAAVQNVLLAAEGRGLHTYWSSGGILRDSEMFAYLGIPTNQMLLGSIFLAHPDMPYDENQPGGLRDARGAVTDWSTWVEL